MIRCGRRCLAGWGCFGVLLLLQLWAGQGLAADVAVLYPSVPEPYRRVFEDLRRGIETAYDGAVAQRMLEENVALGELEAWLQSAEVDSVIALGNRAVALALQLPAGYRVLAGAVLSVPPQAAGGLGAITLAPDPDLIFGKLKQLAPGITRVSVVFQKGQDDHIIQRARLASRHHGLDLDPSRARNVQEAAMIYKSLLDSRDQASEAIWLLQGDRALQERSILSMVLKKAWRHRLVVFSSNPSLVEKGALFSLYPDNRKLGQSLARASMAQRRGDPVGVQPTRDLLSVLNTRTADHLGLGLSRSQLREFDIVFPSR